MSAVFFKLPAKKTEDVADNLHETLKTLWAVGAMVAVLRGCEPHKLHELDLEGFAEAMQYLLAPIYQAVEEGEKALRGEMDFQGGDS